MTTCAVEGCTENAAFRTTKRPAWCDRHITAILLKGGLTPLEPFTRRDAYRLTRCVSCGCEAHYRLEYVLEKNQIGERVCRACYSDNWAVDEGLAAPASALRDTRRYASTRRKMDSNTLAQRVIRPAPRRAPGSVQGVRPHTPLRHLGGLG